MSTKPMKSTKYNKHYISKYERPTRIIKAGNSSGTLVHGTVGAQRDVEQRLGRKLHKDTKITSKGNCWCFQEPKGEV